MRRILGLLLTATLLLTAPAAADPELASAFPTSPAAALANPTLTTLVDRSLELLTSDVDTWQLRLQRNFAPDAGVRNDRAHDIVTTLMMNGLSQVPAGGTLEIDYRDGAVSVWIPNEAVAYDTNRTASDSMGNTYRIETWAGLGSRLSCDL